MKLDEKPRIFSLGWDEESARIILKIEQAVIKNWKGRVDVTPDDRMLKGLQQTYKLGDFEQDLSGDFGFARCGKKLPTKTKNGLVGYGFKIPTTEKEFGEIWSTLYIMSVFLSGEDFVNSQTPYPEMFWWNFMSAPSGYTKPQLDAWISTNPDISSCKRAMETAWSAMCYEMPALDVPIEFNAFIGNDRLTLLCPGNGTLIIENGEIREEPTMQKPWFYHQELTLLAGFSELIQLAESNSDPLKPD